jgi:hypothetical protein
MVLSGGVAIRFLWEETILTWEKGPQNVGYSMAHGDYALILLCPFILLGWFMIGFAKAAIISVKRRSFDRVSFGWLIPAAAILVTFLSPQAWWDTLFANRLVSSPYRIDFLINGASSGELRVVNRLLDMGVPPGSQGIMGDTALHAAARTGDTRMLSTVLAHGAPVNLLNLSRDSALQVAIENHKQAAASFLRERGGLAIRGTEKEHQQAIEESVRRSLD